MVYIINGPNINMLGIREPDIYGADTYDDLVNITSNHAKELDMDIKIMQSNSEGRIVDFIQEAYFEGAEAIIINPGAYTHTSIAILDALKSTGLPCVEVHISDINRREEFRQFSFVSLYAQKIIIGHGIAGYNEALDYIKSIM